MSGRVFGELTGFDPAEKYWSVLTVHNGPRNPVARSRFPSVDEVNKARDNFVDVVAAMCQDVYTQANWQSILDAL